MFKINNDFYIALDIEEKNTQQFQGLILQKVDLNDLGIDLNDFVKLPTQSEDQKFYTRKQQFFTAFLTEINKQNNVNNITLEQIQNLNHKKYNPDVTILQINNNHYLSLIIYNKGTKSMIQKLTKINLDQSMIQKLTKFDLDHSKFTFDYKNIDLTELAKIEQDPQITIIIKDHKI